MLARLIIAVALAGIVALAAYKVKALSLSGAIAAFCLGAVVFGLGGTPWVIVLFTFFISSSVLSRLFKTRKAKAEEKYAKGSRRDAGQVLANGGLAGVMVLLHTLFPGSIYPWIGFCAVFAAANADTWATELGTLSKNQPRLITNFEKVSPGTSGGVSLPGTLAALAGAMLVAAVAYLSSSMANQSHENGFLYTLIIFAAGWIGSLVDSYLGATIQAIYRCPACQKETEQSPIHRCGAMTTLVRGWRWLNNDWVNALCTGSAILFSFGFSLLL